jgi:hypothetical protein
MSLFEVLHQYLKSQPRVYSYSILAADLANLDGALYPSGPFSQTPHGKHLSTCIAIMKQLFCETGIWLTDNDVE